MLFAGFAFLVFTFGFVLLFGAPYLPTQRKQVRTALDMLGLEKGQTLYELGCGDGRVLKQAAERGLRVVGYELNPILVLIAKAHTWKYRKQVRVVWGSFWKADLSKADGVYVFLLDRFMSRLDAKLAGEVDKSVFLASYTFKIPGKKADKYRNGVYLYRYRP